METLLAAIFFVFAILQIILFFKLLAMINDIKNTRHPPQKNDYVIDPKIAYDAKAAYLDGQKNIAKYLIKKGLYGQKNISKYLINKGLVVLEDEIENNPFNIKLRRERDEILEMYEYLGIERDSNNNSRFKVGDLVIIIANSQQVRVEKITEDGKYSCYNGLKHEGYFNESELRFFSN